MNLNYSTHLKRTALAVALVCACALNVATAGAQSYPRLGLYGSMTGSGYPLWDSAGTVNQAAIDAIARFDEVILDASPITPYRPDVALLIRSRHPGISLLAYVTGNDIWNANDADSTNHFPTRYNHLVRDLNGYLYNQSGAYYGTARVNIAKRDGSGRFVVAEAVADLFNSSILQSGIWDGMFLDVFCSSILWSETPSQKIDFIRAGYPTLAAFDAAWSAATDTLADRLRRIGGPSKILVGNCALPAHFASFNGWMRENFPNQGGGTWYSNMLADPTGYFSEDANFRQPAHNYIFTAASVPNANSGNNRAVARFGLGSAALGSGFGVIGPSSRQTIPYPYHDWWYDEYAVDITTGQSSAQLAHTGWLGLPLAPYYQMIWAGTNPDACSNPGFETDVTTGWTHYTVIASTVSQDATTAAVGAASAHVTVPITSAVPWAVSFSTTGMIPVNNGWAYAATFWAKAALPRTIRVALGGATSGEFASSGLSIGTTWKQYQVALVASGSGPARLTFQLGTEAGDVWLDDCHLQVGATTIYRRDFQNGTVLVNPSSNYLSVPLERQFRRISGTSDPAVNDGAIVNQVTLAPSDALFLIGSDQIPPAMVNDLRRVP